MQIFQILIALIAAAIGLAQATPVPSSEHSLNTTLLEARDRAPSTASCTTYTADNNRYYLLNIGIPPPPDVNTGLHCKSLLEPMYQYVLINAMNWHCQEILGGTALQFEVPDVLDSAAKDARNNEQVVNALQRVFPTVPFWREAICFTGLYTLPNYWSGDPKNAKREVEFAAAI